jgi:hypothetical protein
MTPEPTATPSSQTHSSAADSVRCGHPELPRIARPAGQHSDNVSMSDGIGELVRALDEAINLLESVGETPLDRMARTGPPANRRP